MAAARRDAETPAVPVILASHPLPSLWPVSIPGRNYALFPGRNGKSPLENLLNHLLRAERFEQPLIFVEDSATAFALNQVLNTGWPDATIVLVRPGVRAGMLCALAGVLLARRSNRSRMVVLPATFTAKRPSTLYRCLTALADAPPEMARSIAFLSRIGQAPAAGLNFMLDSRPVLGGYQRVRNVFRGKDAELYAADNPLDAERTAIPVGPAALPASVLLARLSADAPTMLQAANNALASAEIHGAIIRPADCYLTLGGDTSLAELAGTVPDQLAVVPCDETVSTVKTWDDPLAEKPSGDARHQMVGLPDCKAIELDGQFLFMASGKGDQVTIPQDAVTDNQIDPEVADVTWAELDTGTSHSMWQVLVPPGRTLAPECHFHREERWLVAQGSATVTIDNRSVTLNAGDSLSIERGRLHAAANLTSSMLVLYEYRSGLMLGEDDRIFLPTLKTQQV